MIWTAFDPVIGGKKYGKASPGLPAVLAGTKSTNSMEDSMSISVATMVLPLVSAMISTATLHPSPMLPVAGDNVISLAKVIDTIEHSVSIQIRIFDNFIHTALDNKFLFCSP
jgi:hypothetical protein